MQIGELASRTSTPRRMLRYYEAQGLLHPTRRPNGYRTYPHDAVEQVTRIRALLKAGLPVSIVKDILPHLEHTPLPSRPALSPVLLQRLEEQRGRIHARVACLQRNLDALDAYLAAVRPTPPAVAAVIPPLDARTASNPDHALRNPDHEPT